MRLGMMNDPRLEVCGEARWAADHGFAFLDLTIEGPGAALELIDRAALRALLRDRGLGVVGHTAWYLPLASPVARVRQAAIDSVADTFEVFAGLGAEWVNVHISLGPRLFPRADYVRWNADSFSRLAERAAGHGLKVMAEHPPDASIGVADLRGMLADPRVGFHLDVGHANVGGDRLAGLLAAFGGRLAHVHLSDNRGQHDDHMPLGAGHIDYPNAVRQLKGTGYDGTITLEVFGNDRDYLMQSVEKVRRWWAEA
jgi:sugar phosphate isomerase/epimerase